MTEKQFQYNVNKNSIEQNGKHFAFCNGEQAKITRKLNLLTEENEKLKSEISHLGDFRGFITEKNVSNEKELKKLELEMLRLYNYFEDYLEDEMSPSSFSEMWDIVKESEKWEVKRRF